MYSEVTLAQRVFEICKYRIYSHSSCIDFGKLVVVPKKSSWMIYIDILVRYSIKDESRCSSIKTLFGSRSFNAMVIL